jgi:Zn ribbon nucleic-acid-binding protein
MSTEEMADTIRRLGGVLKLEGDNVRCSLPAAAVHFAGELRERKPELIALLKARGGRVANSPHCPRSRCASYALYRKDNIGTYECMTCGLLEIEETMARRLV